MMRDGQVHGMTVLARDITASRRNEARFTELFETCRKASTSSLRRPDSRCQPGAVGFWGTTRNRNVVPQGERGLPDESLRAMIRHEVDRQPVLEGREITLLRKDGIPVTCLNTAAAVRDSSGKIVRYQGALMDIFSRREWSAACTSSRNLPAPGRQFPGSDSRSGHEIALHVRQPALQRGFGLRIGRHSRHAVRRPHAPGRPARSDEPLQDIVRGKQSFSSMEVRVRHKQGDWRRILFNFSPLFDESNKIEGVVLSGRDVTDLKRLEEQLIQAEKLAAMGQMLAVSPTN
jgi:PAS domain S-box-containing protein